eukprot:g38422.t1
MFLSPVARNVARAGVWPCWLGGSVRAYNAPSPPKPATAVALKESLLAALNEQANKEMAASHGYMQMEYYFKGHNFQGIGNWFRHQAVEEKEHAVKIFDYIELRGGAVVVSPKANKAHKWDKPLDVFEDMLDKEIEVTKSIHALMTMAQKEGDHSAYAFLQWFVAEQDHEVATAQALLEEARSYSPMPGLLYHLDKKLSKRKAGEA